MGSRAGDNKTDLSVVVITRNEEAHIEGCLGAILSAVKEVGGAEVVVVDSASTDRTVEIALSLGVRAVSLKPEWELSPSAGRYVGFHHTGGELIMFVDADTRIDRDWFPRAIAAFERPDVAAVTGWLDDVDEQGKVLPYVGRRSPEVCEIRRLRGIGLYRRAAMRQAGTFNPYLVTEEEAELALRLRSRGWKLLQLPQQMGCHMRGAEMQAEVIRAWRLGRIRSIGRTLLYAVCAGNGLRFCLERLLPTILFTLALLALLIIGKGLTLAGVQGGWGIAAGLAGAWMLAVAVRKRSLSGPLAYVFRHLLLCFGVIAGLVTTRIKWPENYPLDVVQELLLVHHAAR